MDNYDSDSDSYINIDKLVQSQKIYQIQIENTQLIIKCVGSASSASDITIKENFGNKSQLSLFTCIYAENELLTSSNFTFLPLIKLINTENKVTTYSIAVKLNCKIIFDTIIDQFDIYFVYNEKNQDKIEHKLLNPTINSTNIVEQIITLMSNII